MVLNYIWVAFFVIAFVIALFRLVFMGDMEVFPAMMNSTFETSKTAFEISLGRRQKRHVATKRTEGHLRALPPL